MRTSKKDIPKAEDVLDPRKFDYAKFSKDFKGWAKENKITLTSISEKMLFRRAMYLSDALNHSRLPMNMAVALAEKAGLAMEAYEIKVEAPKVESVKVETPEVKMPDTGWSCSLRVDEEFDTVMLKIFKDGKEMAKGVSYSYGKDDTGVVQGISYAAHMCYKFIQQGKIEKSGFDEVTRTEVPFKEWLKKYNEEASRIGDLARYVNAEYKNVPTWGEKKIRQYFQLSKDGNKHVPAFNVAWNMYIKWYDGTAKENNKKYGLA